MREKIIMVLALALFSAGAFGHIPDDDPNFINTFQKTNGF